MARKNLVLVLMILVFFSSLLIGCSSEQAAPTQIEPTATDVPVEPSPTPTETIPAVDSSIVWSDDFEDGDVEGWENCLDTTEDDYSITEGVLTIDAYICIRHPSNVTIGTWSADILIPENFYATTNDITFIASQPDNEVLDWATIWTTVDQKPITQLSLYSFESPDTPIQTTTINEGEKVFGWHHIDITRDEMGDTNIFFDGEMLLNQIIDFPYISDYFVLLFRSETAIDNIVVRNQVIDIQPAE